MILNKASALFVEGVLLHLILRERSLWYQMRQNAVANKKKHAEPLAPPLIFKGNSQQTRPSGSIECDKTQHAIAASKRCTDRTLRIWNTVQFGWGLFE
jgi:hypothetical protein